MGECWASVWFACDLIICFCLWLDDLFLFVTWWLVFACDLMTCPYLWLVFTCDLSPWYTCFNTVWTLLLHGMKYLESKEKSNEQSTLLRYVSDDKMFKIKTKKGCTLHTCTPDTVTDRFHAGGPSVMNTFRGRYGVHTLILVGWNIIAFFFLFFFKR